MMLKLYKMQDIQTPIRCTEGMDRYLALKMGDIKVEKRKTDKCISWETDKSISYNFGPF